MSFCLFVCPSVITMTTDRTAKFSGLPNVSPVHHILKNFKVLSQG